MTGAGRLAVVMTTDGGVGAAASELIAWPCPECGLDVGV